MIARYLGKGVAPSDLTVITFNQDIQVEKMLHLMSTVRRWSHLAEAIFSFPGLYALPEQSDQLTAPDSGEPVFDVSAPHDQCIRVLKLHGSLNWFSSHRDREPSRSAMFRHDRVIHITTRRTINPDMTLRETHRKMYTLPVIVPPVSHKSSVIHPNVLELWRHSETRLREADELVIVGYSCPALDLESSNQLRRASILGSASENVCVVDPNGAVAERFIWLLGARRLRYYASAHDFLADVP
jgi:hypothetical protein